MRYLRQGIRVHFIGICGIGLSAMARVLNGWGYSVSGSDRQPSDLAVRLREEGITVFSEHSAEHVLGDEAAGDPAGTVVVASSAIPDDNPEVVEAQRLGIPVLKRDQILSELTAGRTTIAVAGAHGKTTTTAMIAWVLTEAGLDPAFIVGGIIQSLSTNARAGNGEHFVIEADEYDRAFLGLQPDIAVVTTLEHDHPDCYPSFEDMRQAFAEFMASMMCGSSLLVCGEDREALRLASQVFGKDGVSATEDAIPRLLTYGIGAGWDWQALNVRLGGSPTFDIRHGEKTLGSCALQVPGRHNVLNALAAVAASLEAGVAFEVAATALTRFRGTERRFEMKGHASGITVIDDYAHHPTEITATLQAARTRYPDRGLWAVFQPHTYSRTAAFLEGFAASLRQADHVLVTSIYAAREKDPLGISGADLVSAIARPGAENSDEHGERREGMDQREAADVGYVETLDEAVSILAERARPGDIVITMGAGDGHVIGERLLELLKKRSSEPAAIQHVNNSIETAHCRGTYG